MGLPGDLGEAGADGWDGGGRRVRPWRLRGRGGCGVCKALSGMKSLHMVEVSGELPQVMLWHCCATWEHVLDCPVELGGKTWMSMTCSCSREKLLVAVQEKHVK